MPDGPPGILPGAVAIRMGGHVVAADPSGALWWPDEGTLAVADLHLEKGSAFAAHGQLLPPYDTRATLERLARLIDRLAPGRVVCLGDSFHDGGAEGRMSARDRERLARLTGGRDWIWVTGNHDPAPPSGVGGRSVDEVRIAGAVLRHCAAADEARVEISGHYHPKARVDTRTRRISRACFVEDGRRLILPAFGAYAGGLNVLDPAIRVLLGDRYRVHLVGRARVYSFPSAGGALIEG